MSELVTAVDKDVEAQALALIGDDPNRAADIFATCISFMCEKVGPRTVAEGLFRTADQLVLCE